MVSRTIQRINILGVGVSAVNMRMAVASINDWVARREPHYVCVTGVHGIIESYRKESVREVHNAAGLVVPDGMPMVWLSRLKGAHHVRRVYGPDLMLAVCRQSVKLKYLHFLYGGAPGVCEQLSERLQMKFPGLGIAGLYSPPFRALNVEEDRNIVDEINRTRPDIVWVGVSTPKQETWMAQHVGRLYAPVLVGVGAAFDFHAGLKRQAPKWMMQAGLEWLFRLIQEPRRLAPRYFSNNPLFLALVIRQLLGGWTPEINPVHSAAASMATQIKSGK